MQHSQTVLGPGTKTRSCLIPAAGNSLCKVQTLQLWKLTQPKEEACTGPLLKNILEPWGEGTLLPRGFPSPPSSFFFGVKVSLPLLAFPVSTLTKALVILQLISVTIFLFSMKQFVLPLFFLQNFYFNFQWNWTPHSTCEELLPSSWDWRGWTTFGGLVRDQCIHTQEKENIFFLAASTTFVLQL